MLILKNSLSWMIQQLILFMYEKVVMIEQANASISLLLSQSLLHITNGPKFLDFSCCSQSPVLHITSEIILNL
jgi:hypothetical protein